MNLLQSIAAVVAGYVAFAGISILLFRVTARDPHASQPLAFTVAAIIVGIIAAGLGGWLTALIAPYRRPLHAIILAGLIALGALISLIASPGGAIWTQVAALTLMAPMAYLAVNLRGKA